METGVIASYRHQVPDDVADRWGEYMNKEYPTLYHWTVRYFPAV